MNLKRGFRRVIFVLSLLVAIITAVSCFYNIYCIWDNNRYEYNEVKKDYEDITNFWFAWDTGGWDANVWLTLHTDEWDGGQWEVVRHLLNSFTESRGAEFVFGDKTVTLDPWEVFPGINEAMLSMPLDVLNKEAQIAKEKAFKQIESKENWAKKTSSEVRLLAILAALGGAVAGYLGIWVLWFGGIAIYKFGISEFIKWLVQGFRDDTPEQVEKVEPIHKMKKIKQILKKIFMPRSAIDEATTERPEESSKDDERTIAKQIAERHNKDGVTLTDPRTGKDLLAGMTDEQRENYRQFMARSHHARQEEKERELNMTERKESDVQPKKKRGQLFSVVSSIAIFCIIIFMTKFLGHQAGRQSAIQTVQRECIAQNAPTGFMGAKWLMPMSQVKSLFPDAFEFEPGKLMLDTTAFGRPAFVGFDFSDNLLLIMVIITFKGEKTESTYRQTHVLVEKEYGAFPEPSSTSEHILASEKRIGRIVIEHILSQLPGIQIEQVSLYRTKENTAH